MHTGRFTSILTALALAGAMAIVGCNKPAAAPGAPGSGDGPLLPPSPPLVIAQTPPPAPGAGGQVVMTVNGKPILMDQLVELMLGEAGRNAAQQLIANAAIEQRAAAESVTVSQEDIRAEQAQLLAQRLPPHAPQEQEALLSQLLEQQNISRRQWDLAMWRLAVLRKLVEPRMRVSDEMLQIEFNRRYGARVRVRHIQTASLQQANAMLDLLDKAVDFARLAREQSTNTASAPEGGLLPPFTRENRDVPQAIRNAAFSLRPGQVSEVVLVDKDFHILKLEEILPPENVKFEDVAAKLREEVRVLMVARAQEELMAEIISKADVKYLHPALRQVMSKP